MMWPIIREILIIAIPVALALIAITIFVAECVVQFEFDRPLRQLTKELRKKNKELRKKSKK